ncbi:MAG: glutathione S-transferase family protein [Methylobacteriaceae bacterium]|nr:glutathione S-transferase family protein [Methylobacteriaceae bacterium]
MLTLVIANKLYSSWSLRPWLMMTELGLAFDEIVIPLDQPDTATRILAHSPAGKVPILLDGPLRVWDTLAILEYLAELHPGRVWPADRAARALARSISAEMHAGFGALRSACPMNLGKRFARRDRGPAVARDLARVEAIWRDARARFGAGGPFLFGAFSGADAMYVPVVTRLDTYDLPVAPDTRAYMDAVLNLPGFQAWREAALKETWIVPHDEVDEEPLVDHRAGR